MCYICHRSLTRSATETEPLEKDLLRVGMSPVECASSHWAHNSELWEADLLHEKVGRVPTSVLRALGSYGTKP